MGDWYHHGMKGLEKNHKQAADWWQRGYDIGDVACTSLLGFCYVQGEGVEQDKVYGVHLLSIAATLGSALACFNLGDCFANGLLGMRKPREARRLRTWSGFSRNCLISSTGGSIGRSLGGARH